MNENTMRAGEPRTVVAERAATSNGRAVSWTHADRVVRAFVEERPFAAIGIAVAAGYLMGRAINVAR
jgi:ElaB/YqjD/DUF883 family membrane-anchored ribosome-binding protein